MCAVLWGYHDACEGYLEYRGDVQYRGGYLEHRGGVQQDLFPHGMETLHSTHDIPHGTQDHPHIYHGIPTVLNIPHSTQDIPHMHHDILYGTEHLMVLHPTVLHIPLYYTHTRARAGYAG